MDKTSAKRAKGKASKAVSTSVSAARTFIWEWLIRPIASIIHPRRCPMCGRVLRVEEEGVCPECLQSLPRTEEADHRDNRLEQRLVSAEANGADKLLRAGAYCFYPKNHPIRHALQAFKYGDHPEIGTVLATQAAEEWKSSGFFNELDLIIPLPLHPQRLEERGYNQAEVLAAAISNVTGIPVDTGHLIRTANNDRQSLKTLEERRQLPQIFAVTHSEDLRGKRILLVDDVITSGTTMQRAMETLHPIRNCRYAVFSLCLAGEKKTEGAESTH